MVSLCFLSIADLSLPILDTVIWLGDFNYRIGLSHERAMDLVKQKDLEKLYENDQVSHSSRQVQIVLT